MGIRILAFIFLNFLSQFREIDSHGRLMNPPARNAMWRFGFPNPVDYNDNELFCGGYQVHQYQNGGKCGICGDNYADPKPRKHEMRGLYGNGIIGRRYYSGQDVRMTVELTSNHRGYFMFRICPATSTTEEVTQECLDKTILKIVNKDGSVSDKFKIKNEGRQGSFDMVVRLPPGLVCDRCVIQWTYTTANTWGTCPNGSQQTGCGPQENFINCADVRINPSMMSFWSNPKLTSSSRANPHMLYFKDFSKENAPLTPLVIKYQVCVATRAYEIIPGIDDWCQEGCLRYPPYCPSEICRCVEDCSAVGEFSQSRGSDQWCLDQCSVYPPKNCTDDRCQCW